MQSEYGPTARFRRHGAENLGCATEFVFFVASGLPPRLSGRVRTDIGVQRNWLLVQADRQLLPAMRGALTPRGQL